MFTKQVRGETIRVIKNELPWFGSWCEQRERGQLPMQLKELFDRRVKTTGIQSGVAICMRGQPGCALANGGSISHKKSQPDTI